MFLTETRFAFNIISTGFVIFVFWREHDLQSSVKLWKRILWFPFNIIRPVWKKECLRGIFKSIHSFSKRPSKLFFRGVAKSFLY